jgi:site-specific DNA recombinase
MKKAVIYARVSSKDQEKEGFSIPAQLRLLRETAQREQFDIAKEFLEVESAKQPGRIQFDAMLKFLEKHPCTVFAEKADRLYRNYSDALALRGLGIEIRYVKQGLLLNSSSKSSDKLIDNIYIAVAQHYSDNLSEEVKKGLSQKASQGECPAGRVPLGYFRSNRQIHVNPELADKIRHIYEYFATGLYSITEAHIEAKRIGLKYPKSGIYISRSEIERMLKKPFYYGKFIWQGAIFDGNHAPIISKDLYLNVQEAFKIRQKTPFKKKSFPFVGLIQCGKCGHTITAEIHKGRYIYYHCTGYGGNCKPEYYRQEIIDQKFAEITKAISIPIELYEWLKHCLESEEKAIIAQYSRKRDALETQKEKIINRQKKTYFEKLEGKISNEFWQSIKGDTDKEIDEVDYQLNSLNKGDLGQSSINGAIELAYHIDSLYIKADYFEKRNLLNFVLSNCLINGGSLRPTYKKPFDILSKGQDSTKWLGDRDSNLGRKNNISTKQYHDKSL